MDLHEGERKRIFEFLCNWPANVASMVETQRRSMRAMILIMNLGAGPSYAIHRCFLTTAVEMVAMFDESCKKRIRDIASCVEKMDPKTHIAVLAVCEGSPFLHTIAISEYAACMRHMLVRSASAIHVGKHRNQAALACENNDLQTLVDAASGMKLSRLASTLSCPSSASPSSSSAFACRSISPTSAAATSAMAVSSASRRRRGQVRC